jgi:hypothetical protein
MITLFVPDACHESRDVASLLDWADQRIDDPLSSPVDLRMAGVAARMALEFHLHELCRLHAPPSGNCWHDFAIRLMKAGYMSMAEYRHGRRIMRLAIKAVHGKPWDRERAGRLLELVTEFVER